MTNSIANNLRAAYVYIANLDEWKFLDIATPNTASPREVKISRTLRLQTLSN